MRIRRYGPSLYSINIYIITYGGLYIRYVEVWSRLLKGTLYR